MADADGALRPPKSRLAPFDVTTRTVPYPSRTPLCSYVLLGAVHKPDSNNPIRAVCKVSIRGVVLYAHAALPSRRPPATSAIGMARRWWHYRSMGLPMARIARRGTRSLPTVSRWCGITRAQQCNTQSLVLVVAPVVLGCCTLLSSEWQEGGASDFEAYSILRIPYPLVPI